jgi:transketolase
LYSIALTRDEEFQLIDEDADLKRIVLDMIYRAQSGHPGGSLSCTPILWSLYKKIMRISPTNPDDPRRDRCVLSKGHAAPALYATLAKLGFFPMENLAQFRTYQSVLQGHPKGHAVPGIEISTGSLGIGASMAVGMAFAAKIDHADWHTFAILGDGECQEGIVWETAMTAAHYALDNLTFIIDRNGIQLDGPTEKIMGVEPLAAKWEAFGWHVIEIDGTSFRELLMALTTATKLRGRPTAIIAYMIKGHGISFMEHLKEFHGKAPTTSEYEKALHELEHYRQAMRDKADRCVQQYDHCLTTE